MRADHVILHGEARLSCAWPKACAPKILRGAVCSELDRSLGGSGEGDDGWRLHVDWHGHADNGETRPAPAPIYYRDGPRVYAVGERAHQHLALLVRNLRALRLPGGQVIEVDEVDVRTDATDVRVRSRHWMRYGLATPLFPPWVAYVRRPREAGPARVAWAENLLIGSIAAQLEEWKIHEEHRIAVHIVNYEDRRRLEWDRPERAGKHYVADGFVADFVSNVVLPDGLALGRHRSEGYGEVREWR